MLSHPHIHIKPRIHPSHYQMSPFGHNSSSSSGAVALLSPAFSGYENISILGRIDNPINLRISEREDRNNEVEPLYNGSAADGYSGAAILRIKFIITLSNGHVSYAYKFVDCNN